VEPAERGRAPADVATEPGAASPADSMSAGPLAAVALLLSVAVLGFQLALMRILLVASWHHFAFVVISIALLGFGASGTMLTIARPWLMRRPAAALAMYALAAWAFTRLPEAEAG